MNDESIIKTFEMENGYQARVVDDTRHYFGGYYDVRLVVQVEIPLLRGWFRSDAEFDDACTRLGASIRFCRTLSRMAVPTGSIDLVRQELLDTFAGNLLHYLSRPDFPSRFALTEIAKAGKPSARYRTVSHDC